MPNATSKKRRGKRRAITAWATIYPRCANVRMTIYRTKADAERDGLDQPGDYMARVRVEEV